MNTRYILSQELFAEDLPCLVIGREDLPKDAPLVVALHGLGSSKEKMLGGLYEFAQIGCRAVALDLRLHGERPEAATREEQLQADYFAATAQIIEGTAQDVSRLLDHFGDVQAAIHGISLGGYITFAALLAEPRLRVASVALGSPDWLGPLRRFGVGPGHPAYDRAAALNPLDLLPYVLPPRPLLMLHGAQDEMVPADGVIALEERLRPLYTAQPERLKLELFPGLGHAYPDEMLKQTVDWFERFLV
jgi:pimeloyl-ACP methyl ester carboxylesterase